MGWQATEAVVRGSKSKGSARLLLLVIAHHVGAEGRAAYPSVATLCTETRLSERTVRYLLRDLEASGELGVQMRAGPNGTNLYRVLVESRGSTSGQAEARAALASGLADAAAASGGQVASCGGQNLTQEGQKSAPAGATRGAPQWQGKGEPDITPPPPRARDATPTGAVPSGAVPGGTASGGNPENWEMPLTVTAVLAVCGTVRGGSRDEAELAATVPWLRVAGWQDDAMAAREVQRRFGAGAWDKVTPPRISQIRREWVRRGCLVDQTEERARGAATWAGVAVGSASGIGSSASGIGSSASGIESPASESSRVASREAAEAVAAGRQSGLGPGPKGGGELTRGSGPSWGERSTGFARNPERPRGGGRERAFEGRQRLRAEYLAAWGEEG